MTEAKEDLRQFAERFWKEQYGQLTSRYDIAFAQAVDRRARIEMLEELSLFVPHQALMGKKIIDRRCSDGCCDKWYKEINRLLAEAEEGK